MEMHQGYDPKRRHNQDSSLVRLASETASPTSGYQDGKICFARDVPPQKLRA